MKNNTKSKIIKILVIISLYVMGIILTISSIFGYLSVNLLKTSNITDGIVTSVSHKSRKHKSKLAIYFKYKINNNEFEKYEYVTIPTTYGSNDKIKVYYSPDKPQNGKILRIEYGTLFFGIMFIIVGSIFIIFRKKVIWYV